ncbi:PREDICTED: fibrinogen-like protein A, partial [Amphimedon queenslandica]|uniref:Fibrinogen C-terminal domain-containing protein n=1 Tax=Amphimedon queenslandica TaxID=400682 RepID=A0AAN0JW27_AMPQE
CDMETDGGGWTVFQRRQDGSVDFYRYWTDYENGFGNLTGEFWLGLSKIHRLTKEGSNTLRVDLGDFEGNTAYANYSTFSVSDGSIEYILTVGGYSGTAGDSLANHNGLRFSTRDNDNDPWSGGHCAQQYTGAWWYNSCHYSNLNDCKDWYNNGSTTSGLYNINPDGGTPFTVYCDIETYGGGWTVFQRRQDGSVDFYRYWTDYENGFGDLTGEFWLGLSKIHRLTKEGSNTLRVDLGDFEGNTSYANYSTFNVSDGSTEYILTVGGYSGTATDSLAWYHSGRRFTTRDNDNDLRSGTNCAQSFTGAWWYNNCYYSSLNGRYFNTSTSNVQGIVCYCEIATQPTL